MFSFHMDNAESTFHILFRRRSKLVFSSGTLRFNISAVVYNNIQFQHSGGVCTVF